MPTHATTPAHTLQENVLFGLPFDEAKFNSAIRLSELQRDVEILPNGWDTEIGEKGVNLSGGQKARISLARACYAQASYTRTRTRTRTRTLTPRVLRPGERGAARRPALCGGRARGSGALRARHPGRATGEVLPLPVFPYRRVRIQDAVGLGYRSTV